MGEIVSISSMRMKLRRHNLISSSNFHTEGLGCRLDNVISISGGSAEFNCISGSIKAVGVEWLVNGTPLENLNLSNVTTVTTEFAVGFGVLTFTNLPVEYNMTRITCMQMFTSSTIVNCTSLLLLQGTLAAARLVNTPL